MAKTVRLAVFVLSCVLLSALVVFIIRATNTNLLIVVPAALSAAYLALWMAYQTVLK
jgi:hypothetical protein